MPFSFLCGYPVLCAGGFGSSFGSSASDLGRGSIGGGGGGSFASDGFGMEGGLGFGGGGGGGGDYIVKMRGLPFSATPADVSDVSFYKDTLC